MQISKFNARKINAGKTSSHWGKDFLTSLLGTTLSIVLTFGTSALLEHKMKADIQRQTAMMVIHDIDASVELVEDIANYEDEKNQAVQYVLAHLDQIDALPADTLALALKMIADTDGDNTIFDDSKEKIFNSSQDIWSNLDNMAFVDNMERFYRERPDFCGTHHLRRIQPDEIQLPGKRPLTRLCCHPERETHGAAGQVSYRLFNEQGTGVSLLCTAMEGHQRPQQIHHEYR